MQTLHRPEETKERYYLYGGSQATVRDRNSTDAAIGNRAFMLRIAKVLNACEHLSDQDLDGWVARLVREAEGKTE